MATISVPYATRWGHPRTHVLKGDAKRKARRERSLQRLIKFNTELYGPNVAAWPFGRQQEYVSLSR